MITRDAKIGLLVILAFCLIVGILLSEHFTSATTPKQAQLAQAGADVRRATNAPAVATMLPATPTVIDADPQPRQAVVTRDVIDAPAPEQSASSRIEIGQPADGEMKVIRVESAADAVAGAVQVAVPAVATDVSPAAVVTSVTPPTIRPVRLNDSALQATARQHGLELVPVGAGVETSPLVAAGGDVAKPVAMSATPKSLAPPGRSTRVREYVAQPGDSLSRIAAKMFGASTPATKQAIVDLNPSLAKNPERILVGVKYLVPADAWAAALNVADAKPATPAKAEKAATAKATETKATETKVSEAKATEAKSAEAKPGEPKAAAKAQVALYEVKPGDSLWKIAAGDAGAVAQIKAMNADVLKGNDAVRVGMKLSLPVAPKAATKKA